MHHIFSSGQKIETSMQFSSSASNSHCARKAFFEKINLIDSNVLQQNDLSITKDLLFGFEKLKDGKNNASLTSKVEFIQLMERFKCLLFQS